MTVRAMNTLHNVSVRRAAIVGFTVGIAMSVTYLVLIRDPFPLFLPSWAAIAFYPGLLAGWLTSAFFSQDLHVKVWPYSFTIIGCIAEGIACAIIFALMAFVFRLLRRIARSGSHT